MNWKKHLAETFDTAYDALFEADQTKMTPAQVEKDIEKRNKAQTIGMEIEFYADIDYDDVETYIHDDLEIERGDGEIAWNGEGDGSLTACDEGGETINYFNDRLESEDPSDVISEYYGDEVFDDTILNFLDWSTSVFEDMDTINDDYNEEKSKADEDEEYTAKTMEELIDEGTYANEAALKELARYEVVTSDQARKFSDLLSNLHDMFAGTYEYESYLKDHYWDHDGHFDEDVAAEGDLEGTYGVEINFSGPRKLSEKEKILDEVDTIMNDSYINAKTHYGSGGDGETGLHIHFGLASHKLTNMDMVRLVLNTHENMDELIKLAKRPPGQWQRNISNYASLVDRFINPRDIHSSLDVPNSKYYGTSFAHHSGKGTVEFRWGHASVAEDRQALSDYIDFLLNLINKSFTGSDQLEYRGVTIKEVSKDRNKVGVGEYSEVRLIAIKDNKVIKKGNMKDYPKNVKTGKEKLKDRLSDYINSLQVITLKLKPHRETIERLVKKFKDQGDDLSTIDKTREYYVDKFEHLTPEERTEEILDQMVEVKELYKAYMAVVEKQDTIDTLKNGISNLEKQFLKKIKK